MTILIIWLVAFCLIAYFVNERWNKGVSQGLDKMLPSVLKSHGNNRYLWVISLAVLGATTLIQPVEMLLVVILLALIGWAIMALANWASNKTHH
ncbi:hypothetical protein [Halomonas sp. HAL1]|uniref:hypothetical protein n=1 Tax=Halomonas sp. HAL1 TaxID=550984 RepID=UPI00022D27B9|nr:hypothetical protein [Halomonas sp. HAL1]EHA15031.1 hypothetical protein HAL1_13192 [Halomonas sp. HAL1]WKV94124.1 hypothetical protein Q3Y66_05700 [Halomonas sp. HAL1]|tara:strand:- start:236 stop:517 length:282 start_codon:yes stop_codon:yes gene_type:complete